MVRWEIAARVTTLEPQLACRWLVNSTRNHRNIAEWRKAAADALDKPQGHLEKK